MSDLGWKADGIARAKAAGGVEFETYRKPGFSSGLRLGLRRSEASASAQGWEVGYDPDPDDWEDQRRRNH